MEIHGYNFPIVKQLSGLPERKSDRLAFYRSETDNILAADFGIHAGVKRSESGAPSIPSGFISISHSGEFLAILVGDDPCGIDVQVRDRELNRGKDWFYNELEQQLYGNAPAEDDLYRIWCAKEAFYKMKQGRIADLRSDVSVVQLHPDKALLSFREKEYTVVFSTDKRYCLAYCFEPGGD